MHVCAEDIKQHHVERRGRRRERGTDVYRGLPQLAEARSQQRHNTLSKKRYLGA